MFCSSLQSQVVFNNFLLAGLWFVACFVAVQRRTDIEKHRGGYQNLVVLMLSQYYVDLRLICS